MLALFLCILATFSLKTPFQFIDTNNDGFLCPEELNAYYQWDTKSFVPSQSFARVLETTFPNPARISYKDYLELFKDHESDCPQQIHLSLGGNENSMVFMWVTKANITNQLLLNENVAYKAVSYTYIEGDWEIPWIHRVILTDLNPNTKFTYKVGSDKCWSESFTFKTAPTPGTKPTKNKPISFAIMGDQGTDLFQGGRLVFEQMWKDYQANPFDMNIIVGDLSYATIWPNIKDFEIEVIWDKWFNQNQPLTARMPSMVTVGNHEVPYHFDSFSHRYHLPGFFQPYGGKNYFYSFDYGLVHFVAMSTESDIAPYHPGTPQYAFFEKDLALANQNRDKVPFIVFLGHRPTYSSDTDVSGADRPEILEPLFQKYGVDFSITGHAHVYELTFPMLHGKATQTTRGVYKNPNSTFYTVVGSGGAIFDNSFTKEIPDWEVYRSKDFGYGRLDVYNQTHLSWSWFKEETGLLQNQVWLVKVKENDR